jgi:hypothetical protein
MWVLGDEVLGLRVLKKCHKVLKFKFKFYLRCTAAEEKNVRFASCAVLGSGFVGRASSMLLLGEFGILLFCSPGFWDVGGLLRALSSPGG